MEIKLRRRMLNRIQKRIDVIFKYERDNCRGIGDVWGKVGIALKIERDKLEEEFPEHRKSALEEGK